MLDLLTPTNVLAHALQATLLAALGTAAAWLIRVDSASVRYGYWRVLLAACLLLPWLQLTVPTQPELVLPATVESFSAATAPVADVPVRTIAATPTDWIPVLTTVLLAGIAIRLLWVGAGIVSLRRLRGLGVAANDEEDVRELQSTLRTEADVRYVSGLRQPATFGMRRPVVLLPDTIREEEPAIRRALISHELFHVQRRDWLWVLCEELLLAACWFNPAMWWLVARVRLAREEAVDELAVLATGSRRTYVRALLAYAEDAPLAPAPAFARRRHLFHRITLISKEGAMSSFRIVFSCAVMALVMASGSWYAAEAFPLVAAPTVEPQQDPGPLERRADEVRAQQSIPQRTDYRAPEYPAEARVAGVSGGVTMRVTVDESGRVAEMRRISFSFISTDPAVSVGMSNSSVEGLEAFMAKAQLRAQDGRVVDKKWILRVVDGFTEAAATAIRDWRYAPPTDGPVSFDVKVFFRPDGETVAMQSGGNRPPARGIALTSSINTDGAVRVGGNIKPPVKVRDVRPIYPAAAKSAGLSGMVIIEARINRDGFVEDARVLRSIHGLDEPAVDAVMQWRFVPTLHNGVPTPVIMTVTVNFTLM